MVAIVLAIASNATLLRGLLGLAVGEEEGRHDRKRSKRTLYSGYGTDTRGGLHVRRFYFSIFKEPMTYTDDKHPAGDGGMPTKNRRGLSQTIPNFEEVVKKSAKEATEMQQKVMSEPTKTEGESAAFVNPSYDKSLPYRTRFADFLGKYHVILNGVVKHDPFLRAVEDGGGMCCQEHKTEILDFVDTLLQQAREEERERIARIIRNTYTPLKVRTDRGDFMPIEGLVNKETLLALLQKKEEK